MIIVKVVPSSTSGRSETEPRGTVMTFVYDKSALSDKNSVWAGIGIKMFGGVFGRDEVTCDGNDAGSWVGLSTCVARIISVSECRIKKDKKIAHGMFYIARMQLACQLGRDHTT